MTETRRMTRFKKALKVLLELLRFGKDVRDVVKKR